MTRLLNTKTSGLIVTVYVILVLASISYWSNNWIKFTHYKGDELFYFAEYLLVITILFYLTLIVLSKRLKYLTLLLLPFGTSVTTFILGLLFLSISRMDGTPNETIYIYGIIYCLTNITMTMFVSFA